MWQAVCQWTRFGKPSEADYTEAYDNTDVDVDGDSLITKRKRKIDDTENYENIIRLTHWGWGIAVFSNYKQI